MKHDFDLVIIGAGPAGSACALSLASSGLSIAVVEQACFPRDKVCGDALSVDVVNQLPLIAPSLHQIFLDAPGKMTCPGVRLVAPGGAGIDLPFVNRSGRDTGYVFPRQQFDDLLAREVKKLANVSFFEGEKVSHVSTDEAGVEVVTAKRRLRATMVAGADGSPSILDPQRKIDRRHFSAGLRVYYENVSGCHEENFIELIFFKDILPGYLWIFPLPDNRANVGVGMLSSVVAGKRINLRDVLARKLATDPLLSGRFKHARAMETVKGHGLPLGNGKKKLSGSRYLLLGDAASLIDPFTGEGIGNAIRSGRVAASHVVNCFRAQRFDAAFNTEYDQEIYRRMEREFRLSRNLQNLCRFPRLFNFVMRRATQSRHWHQFMVQAMADFDYKKQLASPAFFYRLLFR